MCLSCIFVFSSLAQGSQVTYRAHVAYDAWLTWVSDGQTAGLPGAGKQMEAIEIKLAGFPSTYHIDYNAHVSIIGWQG